MKFFNMINLFNSTEENGANSEELQMPLLTAISSNSVKASFFGGANIQLQQGVFVSEDSTIGANSYIGSHTSITKSNIVSYLSISANVCVGPGEHTINKISNSSLFYEDTYSELTKSNCTIGSDVWIGYGAVIRRGVTVGTGAVIGALSFVNSNVPPYSVVAGAPAKIIKYRFNRKQIEVLLKSEWWELPFDEAKKKISDLEILLKKT